MNLLKLVQRQAASNNAVKDLASAAQCCSWQILNACIIKYEGSVAEGCRCGGGFIWIQSIGSTEVTSSADSDVFLKGFLNYWECHEGKALLLLSHDCLPLFTLLCFTATIKLADTLWHRFQYLKNMKTDSLKSLLLWQKCILMHFIQPPILLMTIQHLIIYIQSQGSVSVQEVVHPIQWGK